MTDKIESETFTPLKDWVLVKKDFLDDKTKSGIILVAKKEERPTRGVAMKIGPDVKHIKQGDKIVFHYAAGTTFEYTFEDRLSLINEKDIYGIIDE